MNHEVLVSPTKSKKIVRYPFFLKGGENPHRLYPLVDVGIQIFNVAALLVCMQITALICMPASGSESSILFIIITPFLILFGRFLLRNTRLTVSDEGISFPLLMAAQLRGRLFRSWSDLDSVDLHGGKDWQNVVRGSALTMTFKSGGRVDLNMTRIPRDDLRVLQDNLLRWTESGVMSAAVNELVSRNDFEISDTQMFVFAKKRRELLSDSFGLTNRNLFSKGDAIFGGDYIVEEVLAGAGGHSSYLVSDTHAARNVRLMEYDLKMINVNERENISNKLMAACESYKNLQIPYLLNLIDCKIADDRFYTVMEPGSSSLRSHVKKHGALSEKKVYALALRLAEAVEKLNEKNSDLYLGGIKPDAIMYKADGTVSITEFGFVDDVIMNSSQTLLIDAPYAAPERIAGRPVRSSDLYSIGATMYYALTKLDPEAHSSSQASAVNSKISQPMSSLIFQLLSLEPSNRGTISELVHALGGISFAKIGAEHVQ